MTVAPLPMTTLSQTLWPAQSLSLIRQTVLAIAGSWVLWISAKIQVPLWPVPMTMQTYAVLALAAFMGRRLAVATVFLYLLEGLAGLPVFSGPVAGYMYLMGPTGGYLVGFLMAAYVVGYLAERGWDRKIFSALVMMTLGHFLIFIFGLSWLIALNPKAFGFLDSVAFAYQVGLQPFWLATVLKTTLAMLTMPFLWQLVKLRKTS